MPNDSKLNGLSGVNPSSISAFHDESHATAEDAFSSLSSPSAQATTKKAMDSGNQADAVLPLPSKKVGTDSKVAGLAASQHRVRFQMNTLGGWVRSQQPADNDGYKAFKENASIQMHNLITQLDGINGVAKQIEGKS